MRVLVAASEPELSMLREMVQELEMTCLVAETSEDAANQLEMPDGPHVAILDFELADPELSALCQRLREHPEPRYTIAMAGEDSDWEALLQLADDGLEKPVSELDLRVRLRVASRVVHAEQTSQQLRRELDHVTRRLFPGGGFREASDLEELHRDVEVLCARARILVVEDNEFNRNVLRLVLAAKGYEVLEAADGAEALKIARESAPDMCLLDIVIPDIDGYELFCLLKAEKGLADVPFIFITARADPREVIEGLELGAVDYITKPFNSEEVVTRVHAHLRQYMLLNELNRLRHLALDAHPLTQLPGNNSVSTKISQVLADRLEMAVVQCHLENFQAFNDKYGFARGDRVLTWTAELLSTSVQALDDEHTFVGHVGGIHFVLVLPWGGAERLCEGLSKRFDAGICEHYDSEDRERGDLLIEDGRHVPWIRLSMAGVQTSSSFRHSREVSDACAEVRTRLGSFERSVFLLEASGGNSV